MNINEAYDYIDLLLDKANQPYFVNNEKDMFLNMSITEFMNSKYAAMGINQDFSEMTGARVSINQGSGVTIVDNYVELTDYHHITTAVLNGVNCKIVSDDEAVELIGTNNPFKNVVEFHPICWVTNNAGGGTRIYFAPDIGSNPGDGTLDFNVNDTFNIRYLRHVTVAEWDDIPEQYQYDILNITVRKLSANIESPNYQVQVHEEQQ
tara:strand:- start:432 stop:1052 length:621 start_codon:yes stop_codon:yes gene_type:complete